VGEAAPRDGEVVAVRNRLTWGAWGLLALGLLGNVVAIALSAANHSLHWNGGEALLWAVFAAFLVVGCLILVRRPGNAIGWIFTAVGLLTMTAGLAEGYAKYGYVTHPGPLPGRLFAAWVFTWIWSPAILLTVVFPLLLFPTGRAVSRRWRPVTWLAVGLTMVYAVLGALTPSLQVAKKRIANPIGVAGADIDAAPLGAVLNGLLLFLLVAAIASLVVRFWRARAVERQQLKWFTYAGVLVLLAPLTNSLVGNISYVLVIALPVAVGIAVLRYRLYDIDRLLNRTLVYGLLTALLGAIYAGMVLVLGQVSGGVGRDPPSWVVAAATLAAAALVQPARRRIQAVVDRRFNRRKYDAAKTVEAFSARLRDEIELDTLSAELLAVVDQTMEPTRVSLWLRPPPPGSSDTALSAPRPTPWAY
jgi:hypothetical protein